MKTIDLFVAAALIKQGLDKSIVYNEDDLCAGVIDFAESLAKKTCEKFGHDELTVCNYSSYSESHCQRCSLKKTIYRNNEGKLCKTENGKEVK